MLEAASSGKLAEQVPAMTRTRKWLLPLVSAVGVTAACYLMLMLVTPVCGRIIGYSDRQPPLRVTQLPNGWAPENVDVIRRLAKLHFDNQPRLHKVYWPDPAVIEEHADCWVVGFGSKTPVYELLGYRQAARPDRMMFFTIDKADFRTRFGIWCQ